MLGAQPVKDSYKLTGPLPAAHKWIVAYINQVHSKSVADVIVVGVTGFKGGGGGLYCKLEEKQGTFETMKAQAVKEGAPADSILKGKFLLVRNDVGKPHEKLASCFIMWHEFGHALADRGVGSNVGENSA